MKDIKNINLNKKEGSFNIRSNKEDLIVEIVKCTNEKNKKALAKLIGIWVNKYKISETDLHALLQKRHDPKIRNFTAFVKWSIKDKKK